jgi:hypothetical protein
VIAGSCIGIGNAGSILRDGLIIGQIRRCQTRSLRDIPHATKAAADENMVTDTRGDVGGVDAGSDEAQSGGEGQQRYTDASEYSAPVPRRLVGLPPSEEQLEAIPYRKYRRLAVAQVDLKLVVHDGVG